MITPVGNQILVTKHEQEDTTTASGIVLSSSVVKDNLVYGTIVGMGSGEVSPFTHKLIQIPEFGVGDKVLFNVTNSIEVIDEGETYTMLNYKHVLAVASK